MAKQVIYRRGTTAQHVDFVGANGEVTVDTVKHVTVVHDGVTAGGWPAANATAVTSALAVLTANAANQAASITTLFANAATQANTLANLTANAAAQQVSINAFVLASNSTAIFANIAEVQANVTAANVKIDLLFGNATVQSEAIALANANIIALQSTVANITGANLETITGNLSPSANVTYDLGTPDRRWRDLYLSGNTINLGDATLSVVGGAIQSSLPFSAPITATNLTVSGTSIDFASGGYIAETEVLDGNLNPAGYYGISVNSSDDGIISLNALDSNSVVMSSVFVTNSTVQLNVANSISGGSSYNWIFDSYGGLSAPAQGIVYLDNPGALQFLDPSAASFSVGTIASVGNLGFGDSTYQTTAFSNAAVAAYLSNFNGNIQAGNIITGQNAYVTANVFAAQYYYANGVNIFDTITGVTSINTSVATSTISDASGDFSYGLLSYDYAVNGVTAGGFTISYSAPLVHGNVDVNVGNVIVTNIDAAGTIGANVIQVLSDLTSFGASPAPRIYGFSSIATTGSAVNEGNISASGNLVASQNAYVSGNVFAAQYNFANGVSISQSIQNGTSNVRILSSGGLVSINVGSVSNIALFSTTGASIGGTLSSSGFTATGAVTLATASSNINIGGSQTTGNVIVGGTAQTGTILIGQSTYPQTINIGHGVTGSGNTKTIQIGENGAAGSATLIDIGPATASATGTVTFNTGTVVTIANTGSNALSVAGSLTVTGNITQQSAYYETYSNVSNSGGNLTCNFVNGGTFYATLTANVTANFTNVALTTGTIIGATVIVDQGATPYQISNVQVNGGGIQTVKWAGGVGQNPGTGSNTDVMSFSLINLGGDTWRVLGQISNYG